MTPMLARTYGPRYSSFPCFLQPKLNGVRALYQRGTFQSRDGKLWKLPILHHLTVELLSIAHIVGGHLLDGELYVHGWRLQRINSAIAVNRTSPNEDTKHVEYHIFDTALAEKPFSERWLALSQTLEQNPRRHIRIVPTKQIFNATQLDKAFKEYTGLGYEGIMLRPDGPYEIGETAHGTTKRSEYLWKHKQWEDGEFVCIGITSGEGKANIGIGALVLRSNQMDISEDFLSTFKVGTGFSDEERVEYMQNPPIGKLVKVRYLELTADGIPFNPSFLCVMS